MIIKIFHKPTYFFRLKHIQIILLALLFNSVCLLAQSTDRQGLIGAIYEEPDLTRIGFASMLNSVDQIWDDEDESAWSAKWEGYIIAPVTADINFVIRTNRHLELEINGKVIAEADGENSEGEGFLEMTEGQKYPVILKYMHNGRGISFQEIKWKWNNESFISIPYENIVHSVEKEEFYNWRSEPDPDAIDHSQFTTVPVQNVFVFKESSRFGGWPANNGVWIWGNEILVGFERGYYKKNESGEHSIDFDKPQKCVLARSKDGGETWAWFDPDNFVGDTNKPITLTEKINFTHPDFAMRVSGNLFFISYDRGNTWNGPYQIEDFGRELTSRTDYLINGENDCHFFVSAKEASVKANFQDRSLCIRTTDGGKTFDLLGWMTGEPMDVRSVMSSTVRISENHLVSSMRRKVESNYENRPMETKNWIDAYESKDNGKTWEFLSYVAETDIGDRNGNPPSMVQLKDGRLCITYGYRSVLRGIRVKISSDNGKTWSKEILLRSDAETWDLGYTRSVVRPDGKIVTIYYYNTKENPEQHIAATIWDPAKLSE